MTCPRSTVLIGGNTDLLILLCYHNNSQSPFSVYLKTKPKNDSDKLQIWNIKCTQEKLGIEICRSILVLHTMLGCFWGVTERYGIKKMAFDNNFTTAI